MAGRLRRFTMTVNGGAVTGGRNFTLDDPTETNWDRADNEHAGDGVIMSKGPWSGSFELLVHSSAVVSGYFNSLVVTGKEVTVAAGAETVTDKVYTLTGGILKVGADFPTEGAGRIPVTFEAKTLAIT